MLSAFALTASPSAAAEQPFTLSMISGGGQVQIGDSEDPLQLTPPTTLTGTIDDVSGEIDDVVFSTPPVQFQQEASGLTVDITATFRQLGTGDGAGDGLGNVSASIDVAVDLHVVVGGGAIITDCTSSPIALDLVSTGPRDPSTGRVTLADSQFTIPPVVPDASCNSLVAGPINEQLAGSDNSITLTVEGPLALPPPPGDPSTTTLSASSDTTPLGQPVTFTAVVAPADATGTVTFLNGPTVLGQVPVGDAGTATLTSSALPVGTNSITARYSGNADYAASTSAVVVHTVTAVPNITADVPAFVITGAPATEFSATVSNPTSGGALPHLRVDFAFGPLPGLTSSDLALEVKEGDTWVPVALTGSSTLTGSYGGLTGFSLPPGQERVVDFRLSAASGADEGDVPVEVRLNTVDGTTGAVVTTLSTVSGTTAIVASTRRPVAIDAQVTGTVNASSSTIRAGDGISVQAQLQPGGSAPTPALTGQVEILIDGAVVATEPVTQFFYKAIAGGLGSPTTNLTPGQHSVRVRYLGSNVYRPSVSPSVTITILPWIGERYTCTVDLIIAKQTMAAHVDVQADLPAGAPSGSTVDLDRLEVSVWFEGNLDFSTFPPDLTDQTLAFTPGGEGTFTNITSDTPAEDDYETEVRFLNASGAVPIEGAPGEVIDVGFKSLLFRAPFAPGIAVTISCVADAEPASIGSVVVSGTTLDVDGAGPFEEGSPVPLTASVHPASAQGVVEFLDGTDSLGFAPVSDGQAQLNANGLDIGTHSITARYLGDLSNPPSTSSPVSVVVRDVILCPEQALPGNAAVVRATYLLLLGRCGDADGFEFWVDALDDGMTAEAFARSIAGSLEAHARSVDDAYQLVLGRDADASGRAFWAQKLKGGQRYDSLVGDLAASPEFWAAAGRTNTGYVNRLYQRLLGRAPDPAGLEHWLGRREAGESRNRVAAAMVRLDEPTGTLVIAAYRAILDRAPTASERQAAVDAFQANGSRAQMYSRLIGSAEFATLAQGFPNP